MEDKQTIDATAHTMRDVNEEKAALKEKVKSLSPAETGKAFQALLAGPGDDGREVDPVLAGYCITRYREEMIRRFVLAPGDTPPGQPAADVLMVTHSVNFTGGGLKEWILEQYYGPAAQHAVDFRLINGIYTEEFLVTYFENDEAEKSKRRNRITTFIIPFEKGTTNMLTGGSAYDLGGLEP